MTAFTALILDLSKKVIKLNQEAYISVKFGNKVTSQFHIWKINHKIVQRKLSPS